MGAFVKFLVAVTIVGSLVFGAYLRGIEYLRKRNQPKFATAEIVRGDIELTVSATGEIKPVLEILVGSFVSGPIKELYVDFNEEVKEGQILAEIDPRIYQANLDRDKAALASREADVERVMAELTRSRRDEKRALALCEENPRYISQAELDQLRFAKEGLEAQRALARAAVDQAKANLMNSSLNVGYTKIRSPVDGIVIDKKIDPGQTLAAQFQTPELFVIAPDMREKMHIEASVDEADMGYIRQADHMDQPVHFTVAAYPDETFETGKIEQIRLSATEEQNVVTYPVIVATPNPDLRLLPRMTANLTFLVSRKENVIKIPNAALSFYPANEEHVHPDDRDILSLKSVVSSSTVTDMGRGSEVRHVWIQIGDFLRAVEIQIGISTQSGYTEVVASELQVGDQVVVEQVKDIVDSW